MTEVFSIKGHTWAEVRDGGEGYSVKLTVYECETPLRPERYFFEYRGLDVLRFRANARGVLIRDLADALHEERIEIPEDFDLDTVIDQCEIALHGRVLSR